MLEVGGWAPVIHFFLCLAGIFTAFFVSDYFQRQNKNISDVYALIVFAVLGMVLLANARDLLMSFIGLETMSMCLYIFAALYKMDVKSNESALKYFLLGGFASAFLLFGIALIYGATGYGYLTPEGKEVAVAGTTQFQEVALQVRNLQDLYANGISLDMGMAERQAMLIMAAGLILVGFFFKVAAFPFHTWTPDVYEGTPTPLAGFMATGSKLAAFLALGQIALEMEFLEPGGLIEGEKVKVLLAVVALFTMVYGNLVAARQTNLKRMLAYSSIAHSGYVLLGLCAGEEGLIAAAFYMFIYLLMNIGAFGMVGMVERDYPDTEMESWRGLGAKSPLFAGAMAIFLLSLAGIPPLAGFMAKYLVFIAAIRAELVVIAVIGILSSVVGAYYYLRVISIMFFNRDHQPKLELTFGTLPTIGIGVLVLLIFVYGLFPSMLMNALG
jgi:NADH-quinone oxidoreductase subunit N